MCWDNSFQSHHRSSNWSSKNDIQPREVMLHSGKKYWFECDRGHEFYSMISTIVNNDGWCPTCKLKTQSKLYEWLVEKYKFHNIEVEKRYPWLKGKRFDILIVELKLLIELDGPQHFTKTSNWDDPYLTQATDIVKMRLALQNGLSVIRILQEDVWYDNIDWYSLLDQHIKLYDTPTVIYLSDKYDVHHKAIMELYDTLM